MTLMHLMPRRFSAAHHRWWSLLSVLAALVAAVAAAISPVGALARDIPDDLQIDFSRQLTSDCGI